MRSKIFSTFMFSALSSFIYLEAGVSYSVDKKCLLADDSETGRFNDMMEFDDIQDVQSLSNEGPDTLCAKINNSSTDEIIDIILECVRTNNGLYLSYVLHYPSDETMHALIQRLSDDEIIDIFGLVIAAERHWEIRRIMLLLNKDDRRCKIRNVAPDLIRECMDRTWSSLNDDQWQ
ncbi:MAG: hypothetical protein LBH49_00580 [Puniceicoccales bacterium]|nr:hypothetical protein [Puniceicoccales bacterium]